jgi:hypothetical protein
MDAIGHRLDSEELGFHIARPSSGEGLREMIVQRVPEHFVGDLLSSDVIGPILNHVSEFANFCFSHLRRIGQVSGRLAHYSGRWVESLASFGRFRGVLFFSHVGWKRLPPRKWATHGKTVVISDVHIAPDLLR